jgi:hypothetical protein
MVGPISADSTATLFSASQPNAPTFFSQDLFEWSLHYNLLFHPVGLVSPDPFFFSPFLHDYLIAQPDKRTWYEGALADGLIIPFVRTQSVANYYELWALMNKSSLQGHYDKGEVVAKRLDHLKGRATPDHWRSWPDGMGKRFAKLVEDRFLKRDAVGMVPHNLRGEHAEACIDFLHRTAAFRIADVEAAMNSLEPEHGLRVSEILWASGRRILGRNVTIRNLEELLSMMSKATNATQRDVNDAKQFYKTLIELYNENLSSAFDATKNVTDYDVMSRVFSREGTVDLQVDALEGDVVFEDVELPPLALLKTFTFDFVLAARSSREFEEYTQALAQWTHDSKNRALRENLTKAVKAYVFRIRSLSKHQPKNWDSCRVAISYKSSALRFANTLLMSAGVVAAEYQVHEKVLEYCSKFALAFSNVVPIASAATVVAVAATTGGYAAAKVIEEGTELAGNHCLFIFKLRQQKATIVARDDGSLEIIDQMKPRIRIPKVA